MALPNLSPRTVNINGADCTGSDGDSNRTYTFPETDVVAYGMNVSISGTTLHEGSGNDFIISDNVITFLNALWDTSAIRISYFITYGDPTAATLSTDTSLKYATPLMLGWILGIIKDIPSWDVAGTPTKEVVGTGDNSETIFYLDQKSVVSDSPNLYYGVDADNLTALTKTTHYNLTNDTGILILTTAGVTLVDTNKIYADYQYFSNGMKDSYIISVLSRAEKEVENTINSVFTDGSSANPSYPVETEIQSSEGFFMDRIITKNKPLIDIESSLDGDITASDTTISLLSTKGGDLFPSSGKIIIASEVISYTGVSGDNLTGCSRGFLGTTAAVHSDGDTIHTTILFRSDTTEGTAVSWDVQPWDTSMNATEEGLLYMFEDADPNPITRKGVANRVKIMYYYGYDTVPADITRLTLLFAKRMLVQDNVGKAMIAGRDGEMLNLDEKEIQDIVGAYIIVPMGNT